MTKYCTLLFLLLSLPLLAEEHSLGLAYHIDFEEILDNREYSNEIPYDEDRTIFGTRLNASVGIKLKQTHRLMLGVHSFQSHGQEGLTEYLFPNLYYQLQTTDWRVFLGKFARKGLLDYPIALLNDTLQYFRPNIAGTFVERKSKWGHQNLWIDWIQQQEDHKREQFVAGTSGEFRSGNFFIRNHSYLLHYALPKLNKDKFFIRDNLILSLSLGYEADSTLGMDKLRISLVGYSEFDRNREFGLNFKTYTGLEPVLEMVHGNFGLKATYYFGDKLQLPLGEPLYQSGDYLRSEWHYFIHRNAYLSAQLKLNLMWVNGFFTNTQQFFMRVRF